MTIKICYNTRINGGWYIYEDSNIQAKGLIPINDGDEIKFVCNYYGYDGKFIDEYQINDVYKVNGQMKVYNISQFQCYFRLRGLKSFPLCLCLHHPSLLLLCYIYIYNLK